MTVIMVHCARSGGKALRLQVGTMDNYCSFKAGGCRVLQLLGRHGSASYKRPLKFPDFYAPSTYRIKLFLKQLNCLQVLCKKPNLFEVKKQPKKTPCMWKGNPTGTRNSVFSQIKLQIMF